MGKVGWIIGGLFISFLAHAQSDTLRLANDSTRQEFNIKSYSSRFNPRKALLFSAVFPGAGQIYNKKYWKAPLVWGGFAAGLYVINNYQQQHLDFRNQLFDRINNLPLPTQGRVLTEDQLRRLVDRTKRERDFFVIMTSLWYILQLVDAHVDAHLKEFDLNPELKNRAWVEPSFKQDMFGRTAGFSLKVRL
jgi:hypothetical protein